MKTATAAAPPEVYPAKLVDWLAREANLRPGDLVVDVGCGTGSSTRAFAGRGWRVIGLDPDPARLRLARRWGGAEYRLGSATNTRLPDRCARLVVAGQALHWFPPEAEVEFRRVLAPGGTAAAFWDARAGGAFEREVIALIGSFSPERGARSSTEEAAARMLSAPGVTGVRRTTISRRETYTYRELLDHFLAAPFRTARPGRRKAFAAELRRLFESRQRGGRVGVTRVLRCASWRPALSGDQGA